MALELQDREAWFRRSPVRSGKLVSYIALDHRKSDFDGVLVVDLVKTQHKGIELQQWAHKTPYNLFACFVDQPVMRQSNKGYLYMTGFNPSLGHTVALHYQKRSKMQDLPARYVIKWAGRPGEPQEVRTFVSLKEVEALLRPSIQDLSWIERLTDQKLRIVKAALAHALNGDHQILEGEDLQAAVDFLHHLEPDTGSRSPLQFEVPPDSSAILWGAIRWILMRRTEKLEVGEGQRELAEKLLTACGLDARPCPVI